MLKYLMILALCFHVGAYAMEQRPAKLQRIIQGVNNNAQQSPRPRRRALSITETNFAQYNRLQNGLREIIEVTITENSDDAEKTISCQKDTDVVDTNAFAKFEFDDMHNKSRSKD